MPDVLLEGRDLVKRFGRDEALRGVSIEVARGEVVAVLGPSGSGKSTLLHCLAGIYRPDAGEVWFDGARVDDGSEAARSRLRRERFGFVFQFGQLVPELTALENVSLPLRLGGCRRADAELAAAEWLARMDLADQAAAYPGDLSGGQAQRAAVARALIGEPDVIFADEPTGSLDSMNGERVMDLLTSAARDRGAAVVMVTHDPRVAAYAAREVELADGRLASAVVAS